MYWIRIYEYTSINFKALGLRAPNVAHWPAKQLRRLFRYICSINH